MHKNKLISETNKHKYRRIFLKKNNDAWRTCVASSIHLYLHTLSQVHLRLPIYLNLITAKINPKGSRLKAIKRNER